MSNQPNIIRQLRLAAKLTQEELAARLGIKQCSVSGMERVRKRRGKIPEPRSETVFRVARECRKIVKLTADGWKIVS